MRDETLLKIRHLTRILLALTLFMTAMTAIIPSGHAVSWYDDTRLTTDPFSDYTPAITQTQDGKIWVLWHKLPLTESADIFCRTYNGTWSTTDIPLTTDSGNDVNPAVLQSRDGKFWLFWTSDRTGPYYKIFYKTSSDNGQSWSDDTQLTYEAKYLYVNYYDDAITGNWTKAMDSPYLGAIDYPISYVNQTTESDMGSIGDFYFEDLTSYAGEKVYTEIYARQLGSGSDALDTVEIWLYDQSLSVYSLAGTLTPDTAWSWKSTTDISSFLTTLSEINDVKVYLVKKTNENAQNVEIDAMRIKIDRGIDDRRPAVMQAADGKIWVVWHTRRTGNSDLFYKVFDGLSWSDDKQLTYDLSSDWEPSIIQALDSKIWVFWSSFRTGDYEIFYRTSTDNGASWSDDTRLTDSKTSWDEAPSATQTRDGEISVVWQAAGSGKDYDLYHRTYGSSWSDDIVLVEDSSEDQYPSIFQAENKSLWVAWSSNRADDFDIFYKLSIPDLHDGGIACVTPSKTILYLGYVTPVQISVDLWNYGLSQDTFTVTLYRDTSEIGVETETLVSNTMTTLDFTWNTSSLALGYYSLHAEVDVVPGETDISDNNLAGGTISMTFPGDANLDGQVDSSDLSDLSTTYGLDMSEPEWNPECDFNGDGKTAVSDLFDLGKNYGKSF